MCAAESRSEALCLNLPVPVNRDKVALKELWEMRLRIECHKDNRLPYQHCGPEVPKTFYMQEQPVEREPPYLLIELDRKDQRTRHKVRMPVAFSFTLAGLMRSGTYKCVGVVHYHGHGLHAGHYTATCATSVTSRQVAYHRAEDGAGPVPAALEAMCRDQEQRSACILLYARTTTRNSQ